MFLGPIIGGNAARQQQPAYSSTIKCSQCGYDIELSAMSEHICSHTPEPSSAPPDQSYNKQRSLSNPFVLRQMNASGQRPVQPSPLSQSQAPPDRMGYPPPFHQNQQHPPPFHPNQQPPAPYPQNQYAPPPFQQNPHPPAPFPQNQYHPPPPPPGMSSAVLGPPPRATRTAPPRINPDAANTPFAGPALQPASPRSPSSRIPFSGSNHPGKPPAKRSNTTPMPRLWDLRPPSEELSANLDCAFPPFPAPFTSASRPGSRNASSRGNGSSRGTSPAATRNDEPRSPGGDVTVNRMHTMTKTPVGGRRRPSTDSNQMPPEPLPLQHRRPSLPKSPTVVTMPPRTATPAAAVMPDIPTRPSSAASSNYSESGGPPRRTSTATTIFRGGSPPLISDADIPPLPWHASAGDHDSMFPPPRAPLPDDHHGSASPYSLHASSHDEPSAAMIPPALAIGSPPRIPAKNSQRGFTFDQDEEHDERLELSMVSSAPPTSGPNDFGPGPQRPPFFPDGSRSEPLRVPQVQDRHEFHGQTREVEQIETVETSVTITSAQESSSHGGRRPSLHAPSESGSSTFSSEHSSGHSNSSHEGPSSAASSIDAFAGLSHLNPARYGNDGASRGPPTERNGDHGVSSMDEVLSKASYQPFGQIPRFEEPLPAPPTPSGLAGGNWPLESPMDPALEDSMIRPDRLPQPEEAQKDSLPADISIPGPPPPEPSSDANMPPPLRPNPDNVQPFPPVQRGQQQRPPPESMSGPMRARSRTGTNTRPPPMNGPPGPRSQTPQPMRNGPMRQQTMPMPRPPMSGGPRGQPNGPQMMHYPPVRKQSLGPNAQRPLPPGTAPRMPRGPPPPNGQYPRGGPPPLAGPGPGMGPGSRAPPPPPIKALHHIPPRSASLSRRARPRALTNTNAPPEPSGLSTKWEAPPPTPAFAPNGKPICRGCGVPIEGKSVKAADGRLTGRWHKTCFVCRSCREPFTTADFYVINDFPFCEQHYHEENGSLCRGCNRGIEGTYCEMILPASAAGSLASPTSAASASSPATNTPPGSAGGTVRHKYHPRCFVCVECRTVLAEDYFEFAGKAFCERHAMAAMRSQQQQGRAPMTKGSVGSLPGGGTFTSTSRPGSSSAGSAAGGGAGMLGMPSQLRAERRTTRLMMM